MLCYIQTDLFVVLRYSEFRKDTYDTGADQCAHYGNDDRYDDTDDLCAEQMEISVHETVPLSDGIDIASGEKTCGDAAPDTADSVTSESVQRIVNIRTSS